MACLLHIETSTDICSVALSTDGACIYEEHSDDGPNHARVLAPYCDAAVSFADSHAIPLDGVSVSCGPGSYTGLRIGVSTAKGICMGRNVPLLAVPTLKVLCVPVLLQRELEEDALLCPMIDARRMEVYSCIYDRSLKEIRTTQADIVEPGTYDEWLEQHPVYFFGNGSEKCKQTITHPNAHFIENVKPLAKNMMPLAEMLMARGETVSVAYFEPFYLKEFQATVPKKKI